MEERIPRAIFRLRWLFLFFAVALALIAAILISRKMALASPTQPILFSHRLHNDAGIGCLFCHPNAFRSDIAGIPSVQKCVGCHQFIATDREAIQRVFGYWERAEPIPWNRVTRIPDHSYFSHQPHILAGESCETCHGNVSQMTVARLEVIMDMGWCLSCHLDQDQEKVATLTDCLTCHQ